MGVACASEPFPITYDSEAMFSDKSIKRKTIYVDAHPLRTAAASRMPASAAASHFFFKITTPLPAAAVRQSFILNYTHIADEMQSPAAEKECTYPPNSPKKLVWVTPSTRNSAISANSTLMIISIWCTVSGKWSYIFSFAFTKFLSPLFSRLFFLPQSLPSGLPAPPVPAPAVLPGPGGSFPPGKFSLALFGRLFSVP